MIFKVHCEFFVKADSEEEAVQQVVEDELFIENHLDFSEVDESEVNEPLYFDISKGGKSVDLYEEP